MSDKKISFKSFTNNYLLVFSLLLVQLITFVVLLYVPLSIELVGDLLIIITVSAIIKYIFNRPQKNSKTTNTKYFFISQLIISTIRLVSFVIFVNVFVLLFSLASLLGWVVQIISFIIFVSIILYLQEIVFNKAIKFYFKKRGVIN